MNITSQSSLNILDKTGIHLQTGVDITGTGILSNSCNVYPLTSISNTDIGGYSYFSPLCEVVNLSVGNYTSIARGFIVGLFHPMDLLTASPVAWRPWIPNKKFNFQNKHKHKSTFIGNDVCFGANTIIMEGLTICDGCIIGSDSIITKNIPPYSIAAGNRCKIIRQRFNDNTIARIIESNWFNYDWGNFNFSWEDPNLTLNEIENLISSNKAINFIKYKYEVINDGVKFFKI